VKAERSGLLTRIATENASLCVRTDEKLTAFLELESGRSRFAANCFDKQARFLQNSTSRYRV
jgi:hypothetical protein